MNGIHFLDFLNGLNQGKISKLRDHSSIFKFRSDKHLSLCFQFFTANLNLSAGSYILGAYTQVMNELFAKFQPNKQQTSQVQTLSALFFCKIISACHSSQSPKNLLLLLHQCSSIAKILTGLSCRRN